MGGGLAPTSMALFDYQAANVDELSIKAGDPLVIVGAAADPGWLVVRNWEGKTGIAPGTHIEVNDHVGDTSELLKGVAPAAFAPVHGEVCEAIYWYEASSPDELSFQTGDKVTILDRGTDDGWYLGQLGAEKGLLPITHMRRIAPGSSGPQPPGP